MFKKLTNIKAQMVFGEYALTFFIVVSVMLGMTLYLKRTLQGRIRDAKEGMVGVVRTRAAGKYVKQAFSEYEPYYMNTVSIVDRQSSSVQRIMDSPGFSSGIFNMQTDESTQIKTYSNTASPRSIDW